MSGTLLVVGSAPCLFADVERALKLRPMAALMLVNGAATAIENAEHVLSGHSYKAEEFAAARRSKFPQAPPWRLHATITEKHRHEAGTVFPSVTDWWDKTYCHGATSIAKAVDLGLRGLGFDEAILCGAPMDGSGYFVGEGTQRIDCHRIGDPAMQKHRSIEGYRRKFRDTFAPKVKGKLFSMSGFTREIVGEPR